MTMSLLLTRLIVAAINSAAQLTSMQLLEPCQLQDTTRQLLGQVGADVKNLQRDKGQHHPVTKISFVSTLRTASALCTTACG